MTGRLQGKTALVTAAAQGIGRGAAVAMAREGAIVWATDVNEPLLAQLGEYEGIRVRRLDVLDPAEVLAIADEAGPLDVLFNCAGFVHHGSLAQCRDDDLDFSWDLNVKGMVRLTRACLPGLLRRAEVAGSASIVNMASMCSSVKGFVNRFAYGTTKAAVIGLTKSIAADYVKMGLRCNAVCPGTVDTPSLRGRIAASPDPLQAEKDFVTRQPMGRLATIDDVTPLIVYLASDESRFVTGQAILVDGGVTI